MRHALVVVRVVRLLRRLPRMFSAVLPLLVVLMVLLLCWLRLSLVGWHRHSRLLSHGGSSSSSALVAVVFT
jgi:hypothetical protein